MRISHNQPLRQFVQFMGEISLKGLKSTPNLHLIQCWELRGKASLSIYIIINQV